MEKYDRKTALRVLQDLSHRMYPNLDLFGQPTLVIKRKDFEPIRKKWLDDPTTKNAVVLTEKEADLLAGELGVISPSSGMPLGQAFKEKIYKETAKKILEYIEQNFSEEWITVDCLYDVHEWISNTFDIDLGDEDNEHQRTKTGGGDDAEGIQRILRHSKTHD